LDHGLISLISRMVLTLINICQFGSACNNVLIEFQFFKKMSSSDSFSDEND